MLNTEVERIFTLSLLRNRLRGGKTVGEQWWGKQTVPSRNRLRGGKTVREQWGGKQTVPLRNWLRGGKTVGNNGGENRLSL